MGDRMSLLEMTCIRKTSAIGRLYCSQYECNEHNRRLYLTSGRYSREMSSWAGETRQAVYLTTQRDNSMLTSPFWLKIKNAWADRISKGCGAYYLVAHRNHRS
jgi:hypothetical protein